MDPKTYFATLPPYSVEAATAFWKKVTTFYDAFGQSYHYRRAKKAYQTWYGLPSTASPFDVSLIGVDGEQGEISRIKVNDVHSNGRAVLTMATGQAPSFEASAVNGDSDSRAQCIAANSLLAWELEDKNIERIIDLAVEIALIYNHSWTAVEWDPRGGAQWGVDPATGAPIYDGQLRLRNFTPLNVITNFSRRNPDHPWIITREPYNKFDLAARFPAFADQILSAPPDLEILDWRPDALAAKGEHEEVFLYKLFHKPTEALPQGREAWFIDAKTILFDGPTPYGQKLPVFRMCPGEMIGTAQGSTPLTDQLALQDMLDMLYSAALTNNANNAIARILVHEDSGLNSGLLQGGGAEVLEGNWDNEFQKPSTLNLTHTAPETFKLIDQVKADMKEKIGLNDVALGQADPQLSGAAMALLETKAGQLASGLIKGRRQLLEDIGNAIVDRYQRFAKTPRTLGEVLGKGRRAYLADFTGAKISKVSKVTVKAGNPMKDTNAGRLTIADGIRAVAKDAGTPMSVTDYQQVLDTGNLEPLFEADEAESIRIKAENEAIARGEVPPVLIDDPHDLDLKEHRTVMATANSRNDPKAVAAYRQHQQLHLQMKGQLAMVMAGPPPGPPGAGGPLPPGAGAPPPGGLPPPDPASGMEPPGPQPQLPQFPNNPQTGQQWSPEGQQR